MSEPSHVSPRLDVDAQGIGWIVFDDPERSANVLTAEVMQRLAVVLSQVRRGVEAGQIEVVVLRSGKPDSFIVGADVSAIEDVVDPAEAEEKVRGGQAIFLQLERLRVPTVCAIHGTCMGGGTEMALACTHRVVSDSEKTRIALPEVQLGILPAWGGTTRLPRLVGLRAALDMLLTGKAIDARKAKRIGFAGKVVPAALFDEEVEAFARQAPELPRGASRPKRGLGSRLLEDLPPGRAVVLAAARRKVMSETRGNYPAPLEILDVLGDSLGHSLDRSFDAEAKAAARLITSDVSKNLIHVFHLREKARKGTGAGDDVTPRGVDTMGVVGAGVMGGGIAQLAAYNGVRVRMKDIQHEAVASGLQHARELFDKAVERRKMSRSEAGRAMESISGGLDYTGFAAADLVVEAVVERLDVKRTVLAEVEDVVDPECVIATNTSSLSVDAMARALDRPGRFCGMHFFNPVHRMPLVEVVGGEESSEEAVATVYALALRLGKVPVVTADGPGFCVNRILGPYLNEAGYLLGDGASVHEIDRAARKFGMPMGPLRLLDEVGIDVSRHAGQALHEALGARLEPAPALVAIGETDRLGRKSGRGFYVYEDGEEKGVDEEIYDLLQEKLPMRRDGVPADEIRRRLVIQMINEAARVLEEGIVRTAGDVDLAMIMGTGFPPFRGGLLKFADSLHPRGVLDRTRALQAAYGARFEPPALLERLAREDTLFYQAFGERSEESADGGPVSDAAQDAGPGDAATEGRRAPPASGGP